MIHFIFLTGLLGASAVGGFCALFVVVGLVLFGLLALLPPSVWDKTIHVESSDSENDFIGIDNTADYTPY